MATRLEIVSGRHLLITFMIFTVCQIVWFSIGSIEPVPKVTTWRPNYKKIVCLSSEVNDTWLYTRSCETGDREATNAYYDESSRQSKTINWKNATSIDFGFKLAYVHALNEKLTVLLRRINSWDNNCNLTADYTMQAKLGYQTRYQHENENDWQLLATSETNQSLNCYSTFSGGSKTCSYTCKNLPMFELQSLNYPWYFLNIRISTSNEGSLNLFKDVVFTSIFTTDGFSILWWSMKSTFTAVIFVAIIWYCKQLKKVSRKASLMERMILALAITLQLYNIPLEWFTLLFDFQFFQTLNDIRKDILYITLMIFWLIFTKEHLQDSGKTPNTFQSYRTSITSITLGSIASFTPDLVDSGFHSINPFHTLWSTNLGITLELVYVIIISIMAFVYLFVLMWTIRKVYKNPYYKSLYAVKRLQQPTTLPEIKQSESSDRYQCCSMFNGLIDITLSSTPSVSCSWLSLSRSYRHTSIVILTGLCATLTVVDFVVRRVTTDQWKWDDNTNDYMAVSELYTGVYGLWNIYAVALMYLFSPVPQMPSYGSDNNHRNAEKNKFCSYDDDLICY